MTPIRAGGTGGWSGGGMGEPALAGGEVAGLLHACASLRSGSPAGHRRPVAGALLGAPSASARRAAAEPGRSGCGWSGAGAQPVRKITSKVARTRPSASAEARRRRSRRRAASSVAADRPAQAVAQHVGLAHRAQVVHQRRAREA